MFAGEEVVKKSCSEATYVHETSRRGGVSDSYGEK